MLIYRNPSPTGARYTVVQQETGSRVDVPLEIFTQKSSLFTDFNALLEACYQEQLVNEAEDEGNTKRQTYNNAVAQIIQAFGGGVQEPPTNAEQQPT